MPQPVLRLHVQLKRTSDPNLVAFRYFAENPNQFQERMLALGEIGELVARAERDYYTVLPEDYVKTGQLLFRWLDGGDRFLSQQLQAHKRPGQPLGVAIAAEAALAHLPWEILHDGRGFWVGQGILPLRWVGSGASLVPSDRPAPRRPLQLLFMATSPEDVEPKLDFEAEEAAILAATHKPSVLLEVEESGCLEELGYVVDEYRGQEDGFDVFHLTGHATIQSGQPSFITESESGEAVYSSAAEIAEALRFAAPPLIWLSGCRTGQGVAEGNVPSMAEALILAGAEAVLGWGRPVGDRDATLAAAMLYDRLAAGCTLVEALACTYAALLEGAAKGEVRDWHLLRLFVGERLPGALIQRSTKRVRYREAQAEFLDAAQNVKVAGRTDFVGRRQSLQRSLRILAPDSEALGLMVHGPGGLGKSTLVARICDRLSRRYDRLVWVGAIDRHSLVNRLADALPEEGQRLALREEAVELKQRLKAALVALQEREEARPLLLVLDDFEQNLEQAGPEDFVCETGAAAVLQALVWAIEQAAGGDRLVITCRYDFELGCLRRRGARAESGVMERIALASLSAADEEKKARRLRGLGGQSVGQRDREAGSEAELQARARRVADGNPRVMEWLDRLLLEDGVDFGRLLGALEGAAETPEKAEMREQVLARVLLESVDGVLRACLQVARIFDLAVPEGVVREVCPVPPPAQGPPGTRLQDWLERAVALGLVERYPDGGLRVVRVVPLVREWSEETYRRAAEALYRVWWEQAESSTEAQRLEIHRLALLGNVEAIAVQLGSRLANSWCNSSRYREAENLCLKTLKATDNYLVWHQLARAQHFTDVPVAIKNYEKALEKATESTEEELKEKSAIVHNLAILRAQQGQVEEAIARA